eukprot:Hpha_TRINITY_DN15874_c1_g4::TRINITY_DN15874_c1_g4_i1::g.189994::m.189994/K01285/PRCP; lysosomal Pro-X carboxypeptidase
MLLPLAAALAVASAPRRFPGRHLQAPKDGRPSTVNCTWKSYEQKVDHFGSAPGTFQQRVCIYDKFWTGAKSSGFSATSSAKAPIFFYTGNESPVEEYINNTGLMWEAGERMGALLVFVEHRFEPLSHPELVGTAQCFGYCTTAQALADYKAVIEWVRGDQVAPVIAFGGSYGGMLAGWFRMKYPDTVAGSIAGSAPIWGLASGLTQSSLDQSSVAIGRGLTKPCFENVRSAWPLILEVGSTATGLRLLSQAARSCATLPDPQALVDWAQSPWFELAEGDYPFASTYITYSVGPGLIPLPPWPMKVACGKGLETDFGIKVEGDTSNVNYTITAGALKVDIDWDVRKGNGKSLTEGEIRASGVLELVEALGQGVGVWYNLTGKKSCFDVAAGSEARQDATPPQSAPVVSPVNGECAACPPCDNCPPCPVSRCSQTSQKCSYRTPLDKVFSWYGVTCNEDLYLHNNRVQGVGRDFFWPPSIPRGYTVDSVVGSKGLREGCGAGYDSQGLVGGPVQMDAWSPWLDAYYGSRADIAKFRNIVWSNGALDPWSGAGVYAPGGSAAGPALQNISADGSQVAVVIDLGGHHLDLFFADPADPPSVIEARQIEERLMRQWSQEYYDAHA